jgi:hypothetical protein
VAIEEVPLTEIWLRPDAHARRLIVRKRGQEDLALGWQMASPDAIDVAIGRLTQRGVAIVTIDGAEAELRGVEKFWRFVGPKRQAFELFVEPKLASAPPKIMPSGFVTGARDLGHVAIAPLEPDAMIAFWRQIFDTRISDFIEDRINFTLLRPIAAATRSLGRGRRRQEPGTERVVEKEVDSVLALKGNRTSLHADTLLSFADLPTKISRIGFPIHAGPPGGQRGTKAIRESY